MSCQTCGSPEPETCLLNDTGPHLHADHTPGGPIPGFECCSDVFHAGLHRITERDDGPDLHDLVRLIEYLREHEVRRARPGGDADGRFVVRWTEPRRAATVEITEGQTNLIAAFVGPDGTVYDNERNPL